MTIARLLKRKSSTISITLGEIEKSNLIEHYNLTAAHWERENQYNTPANQRLSHVLDKIAFAGRNGRLGTFARPSDTSAKAQACTNIEPQFWDAESLLDTRLKDGTMTVRLSSLVQNSPIDYEAPYYIFFDRRSVNRLVGNDDSSLASASEDPVYKSEYMRFLLEALPHLGLTPENQPDKLALAKTLVEMWPELGYSGNLSATQSEKMASVIRDRERQAGRAYKKDDW